MNMIHFHLLVNHVPIVGAAFSALLLLIALLLKNAQFQKVGLAFLILTAAAAFAADFSGDQAADALRKLNLPGVAEENIERHDHAAGMAFAAMIVVGTASLLALIIFRKSAALPPWVPWTILLLATVALVLCARAGWYGGRIRHTEIASVLPALSRYAGWFRPSHV